MSQPLAHTNLVREKSEEACIEAFKKKHSDVYSNVCKLKQKRKEILFAVITSGQGHILKECSTVKKLNSLASSLCDMDEFYAGIGGLEGYQGFIGKLLANEFDPLKYEIETPPMVDTRIDSEKLDQYILEGIKRQKDICEIVPCGGAADRLGLVANGREYPAACFEFDHINLLERVIRDLVAREYLFQMCFGYAIETPIVLMTSNEKNNLVEIEALCKKKDWFGRSPGSFYIVTQPSVPMFDESGKWVCDDKGELVMRPGGHGVLWHLFKQSGLFQEFKEKGIQKGVVRQINNPAAGIDASMISLIGIGFLENMSFGFTSCPRHAGMKEGLNVVKVSKDKKNITQRILSNIEYCDFAAIEKIDGKKEFPANTNTLFVDLVAAHKAQNKYPFPGLLLNFKKERARLESTMQNIADTIQLSCAGSAFVMLNDRSKTIAAVKRRFDGKDDKETPERAQKELAVEAAKLLKSCGMVVGKDVSFTYHPALGPLYSIVCQKIRGGAISLNSKLHLEISEVCLEEVDINGHLLVATPYVTKNAAKCVLRKVSVKSRVTIKLGKNSEFYAEDLEILDDLEVIVPDETCIVLKKGRSGLQKHSLQVVNPSATLWSASIENNRVKLTLNIPTLV